MTQGPEQREKVQSSQENVAVLFPS